MNERLLSCVFALSIAAFACKPGGATGDGGAAASSASLPSDFPADVPYYPGAEITSNTPGTSVSGKPSRTVVLETKDDVDKVRAYYAPANVKGLTFHLGEGRPNNAYWFTDTKRMIDVRVSVSGGRKGTEIELKSSQL